MKQLTADEAVRIFPGLRPLLLLKDAGWGFLPVEAPLANGSVLDGAKIWPHGWRDCIRVKDETNALGIRVHLATDRHSDNEIVWERDGTLEETVHELLTLPTPETRLAPTLVLGRAPQLWTP